MAYIGKQPETKFSAAAKLDRFTGDGSTTTFDLANVVPAGGENSLMVYIDNVRQEPGSSYAFTIGNDASGDLKRITFTSAPDASASIYVITPFEATTMAGPANGTITYDKLSNDSNNIISGATALTSLEGADVLSVYDNSASTIKKVTLDNLVTGQTAEATVADDDEILVYDTSASALRKMTKANFAPTVSSDTIIDADSNTQIQVEESADENIIRFDTAGTERLTMDADGKFAFTSAGGGVINSTTVSNTYTITNQNLLLAGPVTLTGTITVGSGATMVVV